MKGYALMYSAGSTYLENMEMNVPNNSQLLYIYKLIKE